MFGHDGIGVEGSSRSSRGGRRLEYGLCKVKIEFHWWCGRERRELSELELLAFRQILSHHGLKLPDPRHDLIDCSVLDCVLLLELLKLGLQLNVFRVGALLALLELFHFFSFPLAGSLSGQAISQHALNSTLFLFFGRLCSLPVSGISKIFHLMNKLDTYLGGRLVVGVGRI